MTPLESDPHSQIANPEHGLFVGGGAGCRGIRGENGADGQISDRNMVLEDVEIKVTRYLY